MGGGSGRGKAAMAAAGTASEQADRKKKRGKIEATIDADSSASAAEEDKSLSEGRRVGERRRRREHFRLCQVRLGALLRGRGCSAATVRFESAPSPHRQEATLPLPVLKS